MMLNAIPIVTTKKISININKSISKKEFRYFPTKKISTKHKSKNSENEGEKCYKTFEK